MNILLDYFDLFGNVHVTGYYPSSVTVFTPSGQVIREYGYCKGASGIPLVITCIAEGQVLTKDSCIDCDSACKTCAGVTDAHCLSCIPDRYLDDHTCHVLSPWYLSFLSKWLLVLFKLHPL